MPDLDEMVDEEFGEHPSTTSNVDMTALEEFVVINDVKGISSE